jgi:hypothetical protein
MMFGGLVHNKKKKKKIVKIYLIHNSLYSIIGTVQEVHIVFRRYKSIQKPICFLNSYQHTVDLSIMDNKHFNF